MNTIVHVIDSPTELFEYARWDWANDKNLNGAKKFEDARHILYNTDIGTVFNGKQDEVYGKFVNHKVQKEASLVDDVINEIKTLDFDEAKWKFTMRLEEGDNVDVGRYLAGHENCWNGVRRTRKQRKVVRIYSEFGGHCGRSEKELAVSGALAVTMCELLESIGIGVEVWATTFTKKISIEDDYNLIQLIKIKGYNEFADLGLLNYITGNDKVFRNTVFRTFVRKCSEAGVATKRSLGFHGEITKEMLEGYDDGTSNGIILIPSIYEIDEAKQWLKGKISKLNETIH